MLNFAHCHNVQNKNHFPRHHYSAVFVKDTDRILCEIETEFTYKLKLYKYQPSDCSVLRSWKCELTEPHVHFDKEIWIAKTTVAC